MAQIRFQLKDGGVGTSLLALDSHPPHDLQCTDLLNLSQAERVVTMHQQFISAGAQLITSNTFCCDPDSLKGSGYEDKLQELAQKGAELARQAAHSETQVLGSLGPGWKSPSRHEVSIASLEADYYQRSLGLLRGGADILWIETVQDPKQAEAAVSGALKAQSKLQMSCPLAILISCSHDGQKTGLYSSIEVLQELEQLPIEILGINCSFNPASIRWPLNYLREHSHKKIAACPNAGLPQNTLSPQTFSLEMRQIWRDFQPEIMGGCCAVSPEYIQTLNQALLKEPI